MTHGTLEPTDTPSPPAEPLTVHAGAVRKPRPRTRAERASARLRISRETLWSIGLFVVLFAVYGVVGYRVVVEQHVVVFDALARAAHAYFVLHNDPPKLAAIGFVWSPFSTLVFLPFVAIKPLATSLIAMPLTSAFFGAGLVVTLDRTLASCAMRWWARLPWLALFAFNPMVLYYAANGMSESAYLCFLALGLLFFVRWYQTRRAHLLILATVPLTLAVLSRYEMLGYALAIAGAVLLIMLVRRRSGSEIEGSLLIYLIPLVYGLGLWIFFNWLILDDPLFWLRNQAPGASGGQQSELVTRVTQQMPLGEIVREVFRVNWLLFPLSVIAVPVLAFAALVRRDAMALMLGLLCLVNAATTTLLIVQSEQPTFLQLRYNMRAMPIALIGAAWLFYLARNRIARWVVWVAVTAILAVSLPITWHTMKTYRYQYEENVFLRALETGRDQEGTSAIGGYHVGIRDEKEMAAFINRTVHKRNAVLTDDAQGLGVMLVGGRPGLFLDRIDKGDEEWMRTLEAPFGKVDYMLLSTFAPGLDLVQVRLVNIAKGLPWAKTVYANERYALVRIPRCPAAPPGYGLTVPRRCQRKWTRFQRQAARRGLTESQLRKVLSEERQRRRAQTQAP